MKHPNTLTNTANWFNEAVPEPTVKNLHVQLGCHFEEVREMVEEISPRQADSVTERLLSNAREALQDLALHFKNVEGDVAHIPVERRVKFLDALCDQVVTATGCAHMADMAMVAGMEETNRSNWSKFVDGKPVFKANGKIDKGPYYTKPDHTNNV